MRPSYTAREQFDSASESWAKYLAFSKIPGLVEVVGLDCSLCPSVLQDLEEEDLELLYEALATNEGISADVLQVGTFPDLDYLLKRIEGIQRRNVLAVISEPKEHIERLMEPGFSFAGYELLDEQTSISALTNCGGFPKAFANEELNKVGLVSDFGRAREIQRALAEKYPDEPHAQTTLYAIWRLEEVARVPMARV